MKVSFALFPWWFKLSAKIILARLPLGYGLWRKIGLFRHGAMDKSNYAIGVFNAHVDRAGLTNQLSGKSLLELGPGDSIATAVISASHGAKATLVDAGQFVRSDHRFYTEIADKLAVSKNGFKLNLDDCDSIDKLLEICHAKYLTHGLQSMVQIESGSVDFMFSQAVLEHIVRDEFLKTLRECRRILKPGGFASHQVDLRDHLGGALNNLRFSDNVWESKLFLNSGFYTNRIRYTEMLDLFREAGFVVVSTSVRRWQELPTSKSKLSFRFQDLPVDELLVSTFDVILK